MVTISQIYSTEKELEEYFKITELIEDKKGKLNLLHKQKKRVVNDISNSNVTLISDIQGVSYENSNVQKSNIIVSFQENALEKAFKLLEKRLQNIMAEIIYIEDEIMELECKVYSIGCIIQKLNDEAKDILRFIYKDKNKLFLIARKLNMTESTVSRKKDKIIAEVAKWSSWY